MRPGYPGLQPGEGQSAQRGSPGLESGDGRSAERGSPGLESGDGRSAERGSPGLESGEFSLMMAGVGGQGLVMLSNIIGTAGAIAGIRVMTGEQHGLSQRHGSIQVHLRVGPKVRSPLIPVGSADALLSLEALEALRYVEYLRDGGVAVINKRIIHPVTETRDMVMDKARRYMGLKEVEERLRRVTGHVLALDAPGVAGSAGNPLTENIAMLGAISILEAFPVPPEPIQQAVRRLVPPKAVDVNLKAFRLGAETARERFCKELACRER